MVKLLILVKLPISLESWLWYSQLFPFSLANVLLSLDIFALSGSERWSCSCSCSTSEQHLCSSVSLGLVWSLEASGNLEESLWLSWRTSLASLSCWNLQSQSSCPSSRCWGRCTRSGRCFPSLQILGRGYWIFFYQSFLDIQLPFINKKILLLRLRVVLVLVV